MCKVYAAYKTMRGYADFFHTSKLKKWKRYMNC